MAWGPRYGGFTEIISPDDTATAPPGCWAVTSESSGECALVDVGYQDPSSATNVSCSVRYPCACYLNPPPPTTTTTTTLDPGCELGFGGILKKDPYATGLT